MRPGKRIQKQQIESQVGHGLRKIAAPELLHHAHVKGHIRFFEYMSKVYRQAIFRKMVGGPAIP